ncbi:MAG: GGDEF domain-containing protein [Oscillospiraceae bacterium]|nr:GGDEF domain-containing protein [Oscillospiraceae bacterium]
MMEKTWDFMEMILKELPSNIFFKDTECRYLFATHYWNHIEHDESENWTIRGKTDLEIRKDKENARLAYEQDKKILETGVGCNYVIEVCLEGKTEYLEIFKNPVRDKNNEIIGIVGLINNVTERITLQKQLEAYAQTDIMTGLYNRRFFENWVENEIKSHMFPISIISADCDGLKIINDTYGHYAGDELIRMSAFLFKTKMPEDSLKFRLGGDEFLIVLPGTDEETVDNYVKEMKSAAKSFNIQGSPLSISYGISTINEACDDFMNAVKIADKEMYAEKNDKKMKRE